ncbi:hypothetical protein [Piscirickettsia litoralis]|uniref:Mobilization protein n=1 Tax=Piscirickettsia litoralis TaxID=1891921 RepID=A0ABX3A1K6_9GAMM|nr:hypothetical protein [Piscirickettsia litoralis]ODN42375.1 hypothetical protein BGC07_04790 [Piscirickettsia litoralis]
MPSVISSHLTVVSYYDNGAQNKVKQLAAHQHYSAKYEDSEGFIHDIKVYYQYEQGKKGALKLYDSSDNPLSSEIKEQIKQNALKFMQPLIDKVDQHINDLELEKANLEESIAKINSQLAVEKELDRKLELSTKVYGLYQEWFKLVNSKDYREVADFRDNSLGKATKDGFKVKAPRGAFTKNRQDRILKSVFKENMHNLKESMSIIHHLLSKKVKPSVNNVAVDHEDSIKKS